MIRRVLDLFGQLASTGKRLGRLSDTEPTQADPDASTPPTPKTADGLPASQGLSQEARVIAEVRALIPQLKALAIQKQLNYLSQWDAYIADINAPAEPGRFTNLEEENKRLADEYDLLLAEIFEQMRLYDRYSDYHERDYSAAWRSLLDDLKGYRAGLSSAARLHANEAHQLAQQAKSNHKLD